MLEPLKKWEWWKGSTGDERVEVIGDQVLALGGDVESQKMYGMKKTVSGPEKHKMSRN